MKIPNHSTAELPPCSNPVRVRRAGARRAVVLLASLLAACGGSDGGTGPGGNPVASVAVAGAPAGPVLAGTTVQLTATPQSSSGAALSGRTVAWASGDTAVAKVSDAGLVSVVGAGSVTITASSEGKEGTATLDARAGGPMGPQGGTMELLGGRITLAVPAGSLQQQTTLLFRPAAASPAEARAVPGTVFELGPQGFGFFPPATLTLSYDPARLPAGVQESSLQLYVVINLAGVGQRWERLPGNRLDPARRTVTAVIERAGLYAIIGTPAQTVTLAGELAGGSALYAGQTRSLSAFAVDAEGDTLRSRVFTWSTSDAAHATVDAQGRVTGQAAGTATITATLDGRQASTTVTVLPRPAASWRQTEEWTTVQGNPRHDGYVAATLDPSAFRELWSRAIPGGFPLSPVATGAGKVFVSQQTHTSLSLRLTALDAASGAERWGRTFAAYWLSAPAFGNGRAYVSTGGSNEQSLWSLDADDGTQRFRAQVLPGGQMAVSAPVVTGGGVYTAAGDWGLFRFDAASGEQVWRFPFDMTGSPAVDGGRVMVLGIGGPSMRGGLTSLSAVDGTVARTIPYNMQPREETPVLGGRENLLVASFDALVSLNLDGSGSAWRQEGYSTSLPAVGQGKVYAIRSHKVGAYRETDGTLLWEWSLTGSEQPWGTLVATDNLLFVSIAGFAGGGTPSTYAIDVATGKQVWHHPAGGHLAISAGGTLFIASPDGTLTAVAVK